LFCIPNFEYGLFPVVYSSARTNINRITTTLIVTVTVTTTVIMITMITTITMTTIF
jgi:hypothetical protein